MTDKDAQNTIKLKREQIGTKILQYDDSKVMNHWRRNRQATVDLLELPVAVERQLEDQRIQLEFNRNPRLHVPTKVDKVRSEQIIAKKGSSRDVGIKANVVNKFVREATGIHTYAIVPPPRIKGEIIPMDPDPDTNPFVKSYAKETKKKPHMVSYGHRPSSASRTFNPGTMKIKMKHNEIAKAPVEGKFEFGLPVGILAKLLKAPKIVMPGEVSETEPKDAFDNESVESRGQSRNSNYGHSAYNVHDPHELFTDPPVSPGSAPEVRSQRAFQPKESGAKKSGGKVSDSFLGSVVEVTRVDDSQVQGGMEPSPSWVSSVGKEKASLFSGGLGNIDYLDFQLPGFPKGGSIEKKKNKKIYPQLTPVRCIRRFYILRMLP